MDPTNTNTAESNGVGIPNSNAAPMNVMPANVSPANMNVTGAVTANAEVNNAAPVNADVANAVPVNADVANAALNPPVNPVVAPTQAAISDVNANTNANANVNTNADANAATNVVATPAPGGQGGIVNSMPMSRMFQSQPTGTIADTAPIAVPEGPKAPDPVEEELKAPLKAAGPVPGSIGSAVSVPPAEGTTAPNAAFNPEAAGENPMTANAAPVATKKPSIFDKMMTKTKMSKGTLILLSVIAAVVVVLLIVVLVMVATGVL